MDTKTVLLVEDHRDSRTIYSSALRYSGYRVLEAADGEEGIRIAREHRPDVILMDLHLPSLDGWQATERLRKDAATGHIPVIVVSVHTQPSDRERAEATGCYAFLPKPCGPLQLIDQIRRVV